MRHPLGVIPPIILERLETHAATAEGRQAARRTLLLSERMRGLREARVVEPNEGEIRQVYSADNRETQPGRLVRGEDAAPSGDREVDEAYDGSGETYDLYHDHFDRHSLDGQGKALVSTTHYGNKFVNAFWDGDQMVYGDGDGRYFLPFTRSLTVIGHELTHGVVQFTCGLVYRDQPGALNEHLADVFGALVEQHVREHTALQASWLIGAELFSSEIQGRALRDMLNGRAYDDPVIGRDESRIHMNEYYDGAEDNGGVHLNSGIPNRAFALAARRLEGFAWVTLGPVWYNVMVNRIGARTTFPQFAAATLAEAETWGTTVQQAISASWADVGVVPSEAPTPPSPGPSPCEPELLALLRDPVLRDLAVDLMARPAVRRLISRARLLSREVI